MNLNSLRSCLRQGIVSLRRNFWMATVTASMIAVSLSILGGFLLLSLNVGQVVRNVQSNVEVAVFLREGSNPAAVDAQLKQLAGISNIVFVSRDEGLATFGQSLGDEALFMVLAGEDNPLPDMFRVKATDASLVPALAESIRTIAGVEAVDYGEDLITQLIGLTSWLNYLFLTVSIFLGLGAVLLIITIIRLSVMARQEEIGVMKYLGASNWYVRLPFVLEGAAMGLLGSLAATLGLGLVYHRLSATLQGGALPFLFQPVTGMELLWPIFTALFVLGGLLGCFGSLMAVAKYLRV